MIPFDSSSDSCCWWDKCRSNRIHSENGRWSRWVPLSAIKRQMQMNLWIVRYIGFLFFVKF
jgi:hypothetical protein